MYGRLHWGRLPAARRRSLCLYAARAISFLEVYRISRTELLEHASPYPLALAKIRWEAVRLALIRTMKSARELFNQERQAAGEVAALPPRHDDAHGCTFLAAGVRNRLAEGG